MNLDAALDQKFGQIRPILTGYPENKCNTLARLHCASHFAASNIFTWHR
jgi:hypothetical protein